MTTALVRPNILYAWKGPSPFLANTRGDCSDDQTLSGYYFREAAFLRTCDSRSMAIGRHAGWPRHPSEPHESFEAPRGTSFRTECAPSVWRSLRCSMAASAGQSDC